MDSEKEIKSLITSILISSTQESTIKRFQNDFINTIGYPIPFRRYGFKNVEEYLRSIPETVKISGYGPQAHITPVIQAKSAHINEMVTKQRANRLSTSARRRSFRPNPVCNNPPKFYYNPPQPSPKFITPHSAASSVDVSKPITRVFVSEFTSKIPKDIQNNLRKLISKFPEGINCGKILKEYKKLFSKDLAYERFNCRSVIEIIAELPEIFHYIPISAVDYLVCDVNVPLPEIRHTDADEHSDEGDRDTKEILKIDWTSTFQQVPDNVLTLCDVIPRYFLDDQKEGNYLQISIGEMYDPGNFWIYLNPGPLGDLKEEIQKYFKEKGKSFLVPQGLMTEGLYCAVFHKGLYHRCIIVKTLPTLSDKVKVLFLDYGSVGDVNTDEIHFLPKEFGKLPSQAIKANLSNVFPHVSGTNWSLDCNNRFRALITDEKSLLAEIIHLDHKAKVVEIYLADITDETNVFYINDTLVKEGHALYYDDVNEQIDKLELDDDESFDPDYVTDYIPKCPFDDDDDDDDDE